MTAKKLLLLLLAAGVSADYWTDRGYTYEVYEFDLPATPRNGYQQQQQQYYYPQQQQQQNYYPQHQQQQKKKQQQQYYPQVQVTQQTNPSVSVSEAEWVCTNTKTQDMMIIASEDGPVPNRVNGQQQWHQVYPQQPGNNQPNYPQPQQPVYPQPQQPAYPQTQAPPVTNAPTTTTEDTNRPIWGSGGNDNRYPQTQAPVTVKPTTTTTEDTNRPIWGDNNKQPNFPEVKPSFPTSTTQKPVDPLWPEGGSSNKPGFTVIEPTRKPKPHKTTKAPIDDDDDDGPLDIVIG